jgi:hypothetical protein
VDPEAMIPSALDDGVLVLGRLLLLAASTDPDR